MTGIFLSFYFKASYNHFKIESYCYILKRFILALKLEYVFREKLTKNIIYLINFSYNLHGSNH